MTMTHHRSSCLKRVLTLMLMVLCLQASQAAEKPNFVVIMVDDMGYAGLSCFGNPYFQTPEIDRLAREGMRLTDFHSSGTVCSPTRAGLVTGRYQQRAGIEAVIHPVSDHPEHRKGLKLTETTFAEVLKATGYRTKLVGKWHLGYPQNSEDYHPQNHGFHEFTGYHSGNIDFISHIGDHYEHDWWRGRQETPTPGYTTHLINGAALEFIRRSKDEPFCLYVAHEAIHNPVQVPGDPVRRTKEHWERWKPANEAERIEKYKGMTLPVDLGVGQIRKTLVDLGIAEKTYVFFFSDNGAARDFPSGNPEFRGNKGSVYEGGHRVPFIAWAPGRIAAGSVNETPAITLDIMPTLLSLSGAAISPGLGLDGVDLSPVLLQQGTLPERSLYWASMGNNGSRSEAMRDGRWKLVVLHPKATPGTFDNPKIEMYQLDKDPSEKHDIAEEHQKRAARMYSQLKAWYNETQTSATPQEGGWLAAPAADSEN